MSTIVNCSIAAQVAVVFGNPDLARKYFIEDPWWRDEFKLEFDSLEEFGQHIALRFTQARRLIWCADSRRIKQTIFEGLDPFYKASDDDCASVWSIDSLSITHKMAGPIEVRVVDPLRVRQFDVENK